MDKLDYYTEELCGIYELTRTDETLTDEDVRKVYEAKDYAEENNCEELLNLANILIERIEK